jgi:hypothetical protein
MYKHNNKTRLVKSKRPFLWAKRKIMLIITALMIGMANGMHSEDNRTQGNQYHTEQHHKKD